MQMTDAHRALLVREGRKAMSDGSTGTDCEHGHKRETCVECDLRVLEGQIDRLLTRESELKAERVFLQDRIVKLERELADVKENQRCK